MRRIDALRNSTGLYLAAGQTCGLEGADQFLPAIAADTVGADKEYDVDARVIEPLKHLGKTAVVPHTL